MLGRRLIGIRFTASYLNRTIGLNEKISISELPVHYQCERFNPIHANLFSAVYDIYEGEVKIGFTHPEFRDVPDGEFVPEYLLDEARKAFPYLFEGVETNPLLWRNFGYGSSH